MKTIISLFSALLMLLMCACSGSDLDSHKVKGDGNGWTIKGKVANGADSIVYIEKSSMNNWFPIDSMRIDNDGTFSYTEAEPDTIPNIYRLRMGKSYIFFPISSKETIELEANAKNFGTGHKLSGSKAATEFAEADRLINESIDRLGVDGTIANKDLRDKLNLMINRDNSCLLSYYLINKRIGPDFVPLYNLLEPADLRILGNVAQNFASYLPNDPRAKELEALYINAKREVNKRRGKGSVVEINADAEISRPNVKIAFYDAKGQLKDFDKIVGQGKAVILNFTRFDGEASPANTIALNKLYEQYRSKGLEIYQIAFDPDEIEWRHQASRLPWTSVWATPDNRADVMIAYNVNPIDGAPTSFIFDRSGQLVKRITSPEELPGAVAAVAD